MHRLTTQVDYFLQVVRIDEDPVWPRDESELVIGSQNLGSGHVQYWAYPKNLGKNKTDIPEAEVLAQENFAPKPAILVNQIKGLGSDGKELELILIKDGHAWARTLSSLANLEDNITSILELSKDKFDLVVEHFMTTSNVSPETEDILDNLEKGEVEEDNDQLMVQETEVRMESGELKIEEEDGQEIPHLLHHDQQSNIYSPNYQSLSKTSSTPSSEKPLAKLVLVLPILIILGGFLGVLNFREEIIGGFKPKTPTLTPTPVPTLTPTPTPSLDRSNYKIRVLNGTSKAGAAGVLGKKLEEQGWKIEKVGNFTNFNNPQTYIKVKKELDMVVSTLVEDLSSEYEATLSGQLKDTELVDVEVVIGKK